MPKRQFWSMVDRRSGRVIVENLSKMEKERLYRHTDSKLVKFKKQRGKK